MPTSGLPSELVRLWRRRPAKAKRPLEDKSWADLQHTVESWQGAELRQIELELAARQLDSTESIKASSKRLEVATWILVACSVLLLAATIVLLVVALQR